MHTSWLATTCLSVALLAGNAAYSFATPTPDAVVSTYAQLVQANYTESHEAAKAMQETIHLFLKNPSEETLQQAREMWISARQPYLQTEAFRFYEGPVDAAETGPEPRINAWPLNEAFIDYVKGKPDSGLVNDTDTDLTIKTILGKDQITDEADVTTGWHAIEFLLWGQDLSDDGAGNRSYTDYIPGKGNNDRRRIYLQLVTRQLVDDLSYLEQAWKKEGDTYRSQFVATPEKSLSNILTALATLSGFELSSERLAVPLESTAQEDEHSCFSDTTHQDFIFNQKGIENVYYGEYGNVDGASIHQMLEAKAPELAKELSATLKQTSAYFKKVPVPFDQVLASPEGSDARKPAEQALASLEKQADLIVKAGEVLGLENVEIMAE